MITGDLNFHLNKLTDRNAIHFLESINSTGFTQHVTAPTHRQGNVLDILISREEDNIIGDVFVSDPCLCDMHGQPAGDHLAVYFTILSPRPKSATRSVTYRKLRAIDSASFKEDLVDHLKSTNIDDIQDTMDAMNIYNSIL